VTLPAFSPTSGWGYVSFNFRLSQKSSKSTPKSDFSYPESFFHYMFRETQKIV
jgi:hypothetical protein